MLALQGGRGTGRRPWRGGEWPVRLFAPVLGDGDLDPRAPVGGHGDDRGMFAEALDLTGLGRANLVGEGLGGHELVPEPERPLLLVQAGQRWPALRAAGWPLMARMGGVALGPIGGGITGVCQAAPAAVGHRPLLRRCGQEELGHLGGRMRSLD
jgi:hypothetical protein